MNCLVRGAVLGLPGDVQWNKVRDIPISEISPVFRTNRELTTFGKEALQVDLQSRGSLRVGRPGTSRADGLTTMAALTSGRLPVRLTPLVGRTVELAAITSAAAQSRLLTLTGPGGTGKTRLALAAAAALAADTTADTADGGAVEVAWVELAPLYDAQVVAQTVATGLGVPETPGRDPAEAITAHLNGTRAGGRRDQRVLVVLDNCEHLAATAADA